MSTWYEGLLTRVFSKNPKKNAATHAGGYTTYYHHLLKCVRLMHPCRGSATPRMRCYAAPSALPHALAAPSRRPHVHYLPFWKKSPLELLDALQWAKVGFGVFRVFKPETLKP